ncbi:conjugal transfer protein TraW [Burkholderia thailandensis]|uniref:conjugal transfer protein TraW n=1 Tax=Burkholderia thailandensis TaxID=57975 RepID=UPI00217D3559|nr:conjugal transfer protein TraW [Burkholderia thailandensis]MCS6428048.1 conjugal transfer protein TraW [Burkholderia thailandensis]MCS6467252.1 conjugal transfer protein TraW [Burkholderia thailandensis]
MKKKIVMKPLAAAALVGGLMASTPAFAICDGCVVGAVNVANTTITGAISAMNTSVSTLLYNLGVAVNENGSKTASTIEAAARAQRENDVNMEMNRRVEDARQRYQVPDNICSESGSGGAVQVGAAAGAAKGGIRPGGGGSISNSAIAQAINSPPPAPEIDASRAAKIHAQYCDSDDYSAYGGARACPSVSGNMPGADKRIDSVLSGAGPNGKAPELTFSQTQTDAARMYTQNSIRRSIGPQLRKGEADTVAGAQYVGLMNQYNSIISAASDPQDQLIADSQPNSATKDLLTDALQAPSASSYYNQVASSQAKATGMMSAREFEAFEVGRRYANTAYQTDLQAMSGDNLVREQIRVSSLNNWLLLKVENEMRKGNVINGQILASLARQEYEPILTQKYRAIGGRMGGQ